MHLLSASFIILGSNLAATVNEILNLLTPEGAGIIQALTIISAPLIRKYPQCCFSVIWFILQIYKNPKILFAVFLGVILGVSFYFYLFTWTFLLVLTGLFLIFSLVVKNYEGNFKILLSLIVAAILSIPYWLATFKAITSPVYAEAALRFGMFSGRNFFISGSLILVAVISGFLFFKIFVRLGTRRWQRGFNFWSAFQYVHPCCL